MNIWAWRILDGGREVAQGVTAGVWVTADVAEDALLDEWLAAHGRWPDVTPECEVDLVAAREGVPA